MAESGAAKPVQGDWKAEKKDLYDLGEIPPLGHVPKNMYAWVVRRERHGPPEDANRVEVVPTWPLGDDDALLTELQALPGFDNETFIKAMAFSEDGMSVLWRASA